MRSGTSVLRLLCATEFRIKSTSMRAQNWEKSLKLASSALPPKLQKLRHQAFVRQSCRCFYCTLPMWEADPTEFTGRYGISLRKAQHLKCTAEHLTAQQNGGKETAQNIAAACLWCNRMRHAKRHDTAPSPEKYKSRVTQLINKRRWHPAIDLYQDGSPLIGSSAGAKC
jgi:hypothetical protein